MTTAQSGRITGVTTLEDLRQRCYVDPDTGCWIWRMAIDMVRGSPSPRIWVPLGLWDGRPIVTTAARAAWFLAGKPQPPLHSYVCRAKCGNPLCIAPHHGATASPAEASRNRAGRRRAKREAATTSVDRILANKRTSRANALQPDVVRDIEARSDAGQTVPDIADLYGVSRSVVYRILRGEHQSASGRQPMLRGASVFSWGTRGRT